MFTPKEEAAADREYNRNAVGALEFMRREHEKKDKKDLTAVRGVIAGLIAEAHI